MRAFVQKDPPFLGASWCARGQHWMHCLEFSQSTRYRNGLQSYCKPCMKEYRAENRKRIAEQIAAAKAADPDKYLNQILRRLYGITLTQYRALSAAQGDVCAVCSGINENGRALSVDHDHACCPGKKSCGKCVRALLCSDCNFALGLMKDNPSLLRTAAAYIEEYTSK